MKVAVVGGGIVGLTAALQVNKNTRGADVTIFAASFDDLVSYVAAGFFRPSQSFRGPTEEITRRWLKDSYEYYDDISRNFEPLQGGVAEHDAYMFSDFDAEIIENPLIESIVPIYRKAREEEFSLINQKRKYGTYFRSLLIQSKYHVPWARTRLQEAGTKFVQKNLTSLRELTDDYDVIFNCSGFGAKKLCNDKNMVPIRGQIIKVQAPWIKTTIFDELDTYIIPGVDGTCTLGGTRNYESTNTEVCPHDAESIRERCESVVPSLSEAKILAHVVGLRPHRDGGVRVETERISNGRKSATIIHNYGHGGYGVTSAPGTAKYAVELARTAHKASGSKL